MSLGASRKSLAGQAAQDVFEAILIKAGLREHEHYTRQFKTDEGSDADFVIPAVSTGENNKIDIMIAVQISSNDRAKLVKGELLPGVIPYLATFYGFDASTKDHQDLGDPIVKGMIQSRFRIVCSELGRVREIERIERKLQSDDSDQTRQRLDFFKKNVVSYKELSESLTRYLSERS